MAPEPHVADASPKTAATPATLPPPAPPGRGPNPPAGGSAADAFRKTPAAQFGTAVGQVLAPVFAEMPAAIAQTVGQAVSAAQVRGCAHCLMHRARFRRVNADVIQLAWHQAIEAAAAAGQQADPRSADLTPFLPPELRPDPGDPTNLERMPAMLYPATTMVGGDLVCDLHLLRVEQMVAEQEAHAATENRPGVPRKPYLASATSSVAVAAREAMAGPGAPRP